MYLLKKCDVDENTIKITGLGEVEDDSHYDEKLYIKVPGIMYEYVKDVITSNNVFYPKNISYYSISNIKLTPIDKINNLRNNALSAYKKYFLDDIFDSEFFITFINYIRLNTKLASKGFFITDENREDVYLEIINTDDPVLIELLDEYLISMDKIAQYDAAMEDFVEFDTYINNTTKDSEIKEKFTNVTGLDLISFMSNLGGNY